MTAIGLAVAIPAVVAYNAFGRANRVLGARLDGFAHELLTFLTTGAPIAPAEVASSSSVPSRSAAPARA